jgi:hypothetical protein
MKRFRFISSGFLLSIAIQQVTISYCRAQESTTQNAKPQDATAEPATKAGPNPRYGDATVESTIRSFYVAIAMADRDTVEYLLDTPNELQEWIDAQFDITYAFHRFSEAAKSHFGEKGKSLVLPSPALVALTKLKEIKPKEDGDKAEWATNPRIPSKLIRRDGHWKMDILRSFEKPEHMQLLNREMSKTAAYIDAIAEDMENGRFETIEAVRAELKRRKELADAAKQ